MMKRVSIDVKQCGAHSRVSVIKAVDKEKSISFIFLWLNNGMENELSLSISDAQQNCIRDKCKLLLHYLALENAHANMYQMWIQIMNF